jgi:hypothetical protein
MEETRSPSAFPDGSRIVHIGLPKTGTTAVQAALDGSRDLLAEHGVVNISRARHQFFAGKAAAGVLRPWHDPIAYRNWDDLAQTLRTSTARCAILSSEALSEADPERIERIVDQLGGDLQVVVTLRALAPMLASEWQQTLRRQQTLSLTDWLQRRLTPPAGADDDAVLPRLSLPRIVREWGSVIGEDALTFVVSDPADRTSLLHQFAGLLGVPPAALAAHDYANASLPYPEAELLRHFNLAYTARGGDRATWMRTVNPHGNARFNQLKGLERHPIEVPRWAAQRSNELMTRWLEEIAPSKATFVGDADHLLVDAAGYPEAVEAPTSVRVDSAGAMADILYDVALQFVPKESFRPSAAADLSPFTSRQLLSEVRKRAARRLRLG